MKEDFYRQIVSYLIKMFPSKPVVIRELTLGQCAFEELKRGIDCLIAIDQGEKMFKRHLMEAVPLFQTRCWIAVSILDPLSYLRMVESEEIRDRVFYYSQTDQAFIRLAIKYNPELSKLSLIPVDNPLTVLPTVKSGHAGFIMPKKYSYFLMDHYLELRLKVELPATSVFYLKNKDTHRYHMLAEELRRIHQHFE